MRTDEINPNARPAAFRSGPGQTVKEHQFSKSENWCFSIVMKETGKESWKNRSFAAPDCQFFEVHGSEF
ncbi:hypothetical protein, partial [Dysosmobacter sp.]|uniref:hypothetical protein n=1 Tax=Dysosmobacter sp. TaxID=2591382 RepID=UPI002A93CDD7